MPKQVPTSQLSRKKCKERDWRILGGEIWVPSHAARAVVDAAVDFCNTPIGQDVSDKLHGIALAVEKLKQYGPGVRQDIGGFIDILCTGEIALPVDSIIIDCIIGIQTTSRNGMSARRKKMRTECLDAVRDWLKSAGILYLHGWDQPKGPGKRYRLKEEQVTLGENNVLEFTDVDEPKF